MTSNIPISILYSFLNGLPRGKIESADEISKTVYKLQNCSELFEGSNDEKTDATKIYRAENICWSPPILSFVLERHGGTVNDSSRAELHYWNIDVEQKTANIVKKGVPPVKAAITPNENAAYCYKRC